MDGTPPKGGFLLYKFDSYVCKPTQGAMMPFFTDDNCQLSAADQFDMDCTIKLRRALRRAHKIMRGYSKTHWSQEFRRLRGTVDEARVTKVLDWYCQQVGSKYIPRAYSARSFRERFGQLEELRDRQRVEEACLEARVLQARLGLLWPGEEKAQELQFIHVCFTNYREYRRRLLALDPPHHEKDLVEYLRHKGVSTDNTVEEWVREVHRIAWGWENWQGQLMGWVLRVGHHMFDEMGAEWVREYCGTSKRWWRIKELLGYES